IGSNLLVAGDEAWGWLFGMWDALGQWWNSLPWWMQSLIILGGFFAFWALFPELSMLAALQAFGWGQVAFSYGPAILHFLKDPSILGHYLVHTPPAQIAHDVIQLMLDYPGVKGVSEAEGIMRMLAKQSPDDYLVVVNELAGLATTVGSSQLADAAVQLLTALGVDLDGPSIADSFSASPLR
ncbi:MAG: hypothetical protein QM675_09680, partial [Protaetiibacter sp.]